MKPLILTRKGWLTPHASALILTAALTISATANAENRSQQFSIPAGSLASALNLLAESGGLQLVYDAAITDGLSSKGLSGNYTPESALQRLLSSSGLTYHFVENGNVVIERQPLNYKQDSSTLPVVNVVGKMIVGGEEPYNSDYNAPNATSAMKTDAPIMETPFSVKVVPKEVMKDQQVVRIEDAMRNVAGVTTTPSNGGMSDSFQIRGFNNDTLYRNGFLLPSANGGNTSKRETANIERIEVLKGPGSILYGRTEPGGIINLVTKKPQATPYYSLQQQFGSFDFYRTTADATGAITQDDSLLYRLNLAYENSGSFRDFQSAERFFVAPSLTWNISNRTQANLDVEYQRFDETGDPGIPPIGNRPADVPRNRFAGEPLNNKNVGDREYVGFNWSHEFNDDWKITQRFGAEFLDFTTDFTYFFGRIPPTGIIPSSQRGFNNGVTHQQEYYTTLNLTGKFATGFLEHTLLTGFDFFTIDMQQPLFANDQPISDLNIFSPSYMTSIPSSSEWGRIIQSQDWWSLYIQDQVKLPYNVFANFGLRYDNATSNNYNSWDSGPTDTAQDKVSPRGGLLWKPLEWLSLYGSYSESLGQNSSLNNMPGQNIVKPQTAEQWELGAKTEFLDGRVSSTFAYFDLTKQNVAYTDWSSAIPITKAIGEQESRGYEFEASGEILPGWKVIGAYTHLAYASINKDGNDGVSGNTGNRMFLAPRNFGSLWNTYEIQTGNLRGLKFGAGVVGADQSQGNPENSYQLPGYTTINLLTSYGMNIGKTKATVQLNVNNLLDKTYYSGSNGGNFISFGAPRTFMGSIKLEY